uniref:Nucleolin-like isoform X1 n=1 Tax=Crassostrea virginica TaxID=6565 RepID=A0A8B8EKP2_CRAVI|nr:nucleolin-like isoform X1 [Crassostrea virginica]
MGFSRSEAYDVLELPIGADQDSVRTSYKRLALKWHPDKHRNSTESIKKFQEISKAYKKLMEDDGDVLLQSMTLDQMMQLFRDVFFSRTLNSYDGSGDDSSEYDYDDDDDDDMESDDEQFSNLPVYHDRYRLKDSKKSKVSESHSRRLTEDEINRNAEELITEEEKEKRRVEKRKAKKKRRREKKKLEKQKEKTKVELNGQVKTKDTINTDIQSGNKTKKEKRPGISSTSDDSGFDPNSAFFTKVINKKKKASSGTDSAGRRERSKHGSDEESEDLDPVVLRSRQLAIKGNEMAQLGHYSAAIELFTEAIKLDPNDFRFFGNRSYCFDRENQFDRALKDAEKAISLQKDWPKGYFRKGRALAGLSMYSEAEDAFTQVLKLDKNCDDAVQELLRVRIHQIEDMGFSSAQAKEAIKKFSTVQAALDSLLAGVAERALGSEIYVSDDESGFTTPSLSKTKPQNADAKMDPRNPEGLTALWVGNVLPDKVDDKKLLKIFSKYGPVTSVRTLPEKFCAFVNFKTKEAAGKAMQSLQGAECGGQKLLIKFPDNPIVNSGTLTIRKAPQQTTPQQRPTYIGKAVVAQPPTLTPVTNNICPAAMDPKNTGPVNGDECYFWRTTGCSFGDKCRNKHLPASKGVDKKPWQKT